MKNAKPKIVYNAIRTPDGTILESIHRHDYNAHTDKNGYTYAVDGGTAYLRRVINSEAPQCEDLSLTTNNPHSIIREKVTWGTLGKDGKGPVKQITIKDMTTDHIEACLRDVTALGIIITDDWVVLQTMINELEYRKDNI